MRTCYLSKMEVTFIRLLLPQVRVPQCITLPNYVIKNKRLNAVIVFIYTLLVQFDSMLADTGNMRDISGHLN